MPVLLSFRTEAKRRGRSGPEEFWDSVLNEVMMKDNFRAKAAVNAIKVPRPKFNFFFGTWLLDLPPILVFYDCLM